MAGVAAWPIRAASGASDWDNAVRQRDRIRELMVGQLSADAVEAAVVVSEEGNYPPWVRLEAWLPDEGMRSVESRRRVLLEFTVSVAPYHQFPVLLTLRLSKGGKRLEVPARGDLGSDDVRAWIRYALDRGPKPANYHPFHDALTAFFLSFVPFVRSPLINRLDDRYRSTRLTPEALLRTVAFVLFVAGVGGSGGLLLIVLAIAAFAGAFAVADRPHVVVAPSQPRAPPPRRLAIVDSWHSVASGCGDVAGVFEDRFVAALKAASGDPALGVSVAPELITYRTSNGYQERQRLVVSRNQATVLIDVHPAGDDLYVGWHGYLNWAQWIESAPVSVRIEDGANHQFRALAPGLYRPNEFDLVDLNCIADLVHRVLRHEIERLLKEREIDEEIDFEILRGDRQRAFDAGRYAGELADPDARDNTWTHLMRSMGSWRSAGSGEPATAPMFDQGLRAYMIGVYNYMTLGLGVTGLVAYAAFALGTVETGYGRLALTDFGHAIYVSPLRWLIVLSPLALVFYLSARINSMSVASARSAFLALAALIGLSMSALLVVYTGASIERAFFATAAGFASLSLYGYTTQRSLSAMGSFMIMGIVGLIVASLLNVFLLHGSGLQFGLSILCVTIFAGLTAWKTQSIKEMNYSGDAYEIAYKRSIHGALRLYLDFIPRPS